jgi:flagellar biogenesis protein FliO
MAGSALVATLALGGLCVLMWFLARLAKKRMGIGAGTVSSNGLRVVGKRPLDQKSALYVIEIAGGRHILVGSSIDGSVSKVDDISPEEYAAMSDEPKAPKLRVAKSAVSSDDSEPATDAHDDDEDAAEAATPQFATVGQSFSHFLGKAKSARNRRASGE